MIVIVDGPEAAGKTTLIRAVTEMVRTEQGHRFSTVKVRKEGPTPSWTVYPCQLAQDYAKPSEFVVWDRSWCSEVVYNRLLGRGRDLNEAEIEDLCSRFVAYSGGEMFMVLAPPEVLAARRLKRAERGQLDDLAVDPGAELLEFTEYAERHRWQRVSGTEDVEESVQRMRERLAADEQV